MGDVNKRWFLNFILHIEAIMYFSSIYIKEAKAKLSLLFFSCVLGRQKYSKRSEDDLSISVGTF